MSEPIPETCPRCHGWVWHRMTPCNCEPTQLAAPHKQADWLEAVGARLRACRESDGLSLEALAERSGMSKVGLWQIEKGRSEPSASTLCALACVFGVSVDYLLLRAES